MGGIIKVRFPNDLWWSDIPYEVVLKWYDLEVTYLTDKTCFADIINSDGVKTHVEIYRHDYDKIKDQKIFKFGYNPNKYRFNF